MSIGHKVWTGVFVGGEWVRTAMGVVVGIHSGYYDVDIMSLHGGAPWITQQTHVEPVDEPVKPPLTK